MLAGARIALLAIAIPLVAYRLTLLAAFYTLDIAKTGFYPPQQNISIDYAFVRPHAALLFSRRPGEPAELILRVASPQPLPPRQLTLRYDPIYLIAQAHGRPALGVAVSLAYLLHPATHNMNLFDFHTDAFGATALLFALWAIDRRRWVVLIVASVVVIAAKENFAITIAWLGIWLIFQRHWRVGTALLLLGVGWFVLATRVIMPMFNGYATMVQFGRFGQYGNSLPDIARTMLSKPQAVFGDLLQPDRRVYLLALLLPFAFLPLLSPKHLALALPAIAINLLSSFDLQRTLSYHYNALPVAVLAVAMLYGLLRVTRWSKRPRLAMSICVSAVALCCCLGLTSNFSRLSSYIQHSGEDSQRHEVYDIIVAALPPQAAVSAPIRIQPHLAQRVQAYMFPNPFEWSVFYNPQGLPIPISVDYILYDSRRPDDFYIPRATKLSILADLRRSGLYRTVVDYDGILLLQRSGVLINQRCFGPDWKAARCLVR